MNTYQFCLCLKLSAQLERELGTHVQREKEAPQIAGLNYHAFVIGTLVSLEIKRELEVLLNP